jgi:hypothetical protein
VPFHGVQVPSGMAPVIFTYYLVEKFCPVLEITKIIKINAKIRIL